MQTGIAYLTCLQGFVGKINGLGHLWFVTAILACYAITPILQLFKKKNNILFIGLIILGMCEYCIFKWQLTRFSWFFLYATGYSCANLSGKIKYSFVVILLILSVYLCATIKWDDLLNHTYCSRIFHDILGLTICLSGILFLEMMQFKRLHSGVVFFDRLSYPIYIVHHIFILGPFSIAYALNYKILNIAIILIVTLVISWILDRATFFITNKIDMCLRN